MPPKVRDLIEELKKWGFNDRGGKGSHRNYYHPLCSKIVTMSGKLASDAQRYQVKQVKEAIKEVQENEKGS